MAKNPAVLWTVPQSLLNDEKAQARTNIGAASEASVTDLGSTITVVTWDGSADIYNQLKTLITAKKLPVLWYNNYHWWPTDFDDDGRYVFQTCYGENGTFAWATILKDHPENNGVYVEPCANVLADWTQNDSSSKSFILHKPTDMAHIHHLAINSNDYLVDLDTNNVVSQADKVTRAQITSWADNGGINLLYTSDGSFSCIYFQQAQGLPNNNFQIRFARCGGETEANYIQIINFDEESGGTGYLKKGTTSSLRLTVASDLATVATTGSYNDLSSKPAILKVEKWISSTGGIHSSTNGKITINMQNELLDLKEDVSSSAVTFSTQLVPETPADDNHILLSQEIQKGSYSYEVARWSSSGIGSSGTPIYVDSQGVLKGFAASGFRNLGTNIMTSATTSTSLSDTEKMLALTTSGTNINSHTFADFRDFVLSGVTITPTSSHKRLKLGSFDYLARVENTTASALIKLNAYNPSSGELNKGSSIVLFANITMSYDGTVPTQHGYHVTLSCLNDNGWSTPIQIGTSTIEPFKPALVVQTSGSDSTIYLVIERYKTSYKSMGGTEISVVKMGNTSDFTWALTCDSTDYASGDFVWEVNPIYADNSDKVDGYHIDVPGGSTDNTIHFY